MQFGLPRPLVINLCVDRASLGVTYTPGYGVSIEEVREHPRNVTQLVGLQSVNGLVLLLENGLETLHVVFLQQTEPL